MKPLEPPPPPPPHIAAPLQGREKAPHRWKGLNLDLTVTERAVWCPSHRGCAEAARQLLDLPVEYPPGDASAPAEIPP